MAHRSRAMRLFSACAGIALVFQLGLRPSQAGQRTVAQAVESRALPIGHLYPSGVVKFGIEGPGVVISGVQCAADSNIYYSGYPSIVTAEQFLRQGRLPGLTKLSLVSEAVVNFQVDRPSGYAASQGRGFYVSPRGDVYGLVYAYRHAIGSNGANWADNIVTEYNSDGTVDQFVKLTPPAGMHFIADKIAVFPDGTILAAGEKLVGPGRPEAGLLTGIFDRSGGFIAKLTLPHDVTFHERGGGGKRLSEHRKDLDFAFSLEAVRAGLMVGSPDGTIYMIRASSPARVFVIGLGGQVSREFQIKPPPSTLRPTQASFGPGGKLIVDFSHAPDAKDPHSAQTLARVDPATGKVISAYAVPSGAGIPACGTQNEVLFLRSGKSGDVEVAKFVPQ